MRISDWSSDVCSSDLVGSLPLCRECAVPCVHEALSLHAGFQIYRCDAPLRLPQAAALGQVDPLSAAQAAAAALSLQIWHRDSRIYQGRSRSEEHTSELQSLMRISYAVFSLKKQ